MRLSARKGCQIAAKHTLKVLHPNIAFWFKVSLLILSGKRVRDVFQKLLRHYRTKMLVSHQKTRINTPLRHWIYCMWVDIDIIYRLKIIYKCIIYIH